MNLAELSSCSVHVSLRLTKHSQGNVKYVASHNLRGHANLEMQNVFDWFRWVLGYFCFVVFCCCCCCCFEIVLHCGGLKLTMYSRLALNSICLPQYPECLEYSYEPLCPDLEKKILSVCIPTSVKDTVWHVVHDHRILFNPAHIHKMVTG